MKIYLKAKIVLLAVAMLFAVSQCQTADDDEVEISVPGYPYKFYSGNLLLGIIEAKVYHYVFFPSQNDLTNDPLLVWFAGAPGCSALLSCFHENGPFIFEPTKKTFTVNQQSWNKKANVLYLEIPGSTGYSFSQSNKTIDDDSYTKDAADTIRLFFSRFPTYKKNDLYLVGHGFGGIHVAYLAKFMIEQNNSPYQVYNDKWKLKGMMVGNPCVRPDECYGTGSSKLSEYHYEFLYKRGYFSKKDWSNYRASCLLNYDSFDCFTQRENLNKLFNATNSSMYNIYDKCYKAKTTEFSYVNTGCEDEAGIVNFLNDPSIRNKFNINVEKEWVPCNFTVFEQYHGRNNSFWIYPFLIQNKLKIWVYSGDVDSFIPIIGTKRWVEELRHSLEMPVRRVWREWWVPGRHPGEDQVGGFIWELRDLTFVTVKGAGFRAGIDQPQAMSQILAGFIAGKTLPYKS